MALVHMVAVEMRGMLEHLTTSAAVAACSAALHADATVARALPAGGPQLHYYHQCLLKYGSRHRYMAFIDNDEV